MHLHIFINQSRLCLNKSTVARALNHLEDKGYVPRTPSESDRRVLLVEPTEKMQAAYPEVRQITRDWNEQLAEGINADELALFFDILSHISAGSPEGTEIPGEYHRLQDAVRYIYNNCFSSEIAVEDLCRLCNYSPAYLRKLFVKYFQMPPTKYIRHLKLEQAKNMLVLTHKPVSQVAREAGYKDIAHFDRVFKKETGVAPLEYRSRNFISHLTEI